MLGFTMPTIKNKTSQLQVFAGQEIDGQKFQTVAIPQGQAKSVPAKLWAKYVDRPSIRAQIDNRRLMVIHSPDDDATEQAPSPVAPPASSPAAPPANPDEETKGGWAAMHWKTAEKMIAVEGDKSTLERLLENETRPKFVEMLSARIEELEGD